MRDPVFIAGKSILYLDTIDDSARFHRSMGERLFMAPVASFAKLTMNPSEYAKSFRTSWSGLKRELPANVHLLTLEEFGDDSYLIRLEHFYEKNEDATLSKDATVSLKVGQSFAVVK